MPNPTAAILVIGDEILSGRTRDSNMHFLAQELTKQGIDLKEARVVSDNRAAIIEAVRALSAGHDHVFTSGGIGPTHDDITADCIAAAFDVTIGIRDDARALLAAHYARQGVEFNAARQRMARIPEGATLIDNPVSKAPGFSLGNVHVMAGVPSVFAAMVEGLLPRLTGGAPLLSATVQAGLPEGELAAALAELAAAFPDVGIGCYPFNFGDRPGANLVARSADPDRLAAAEAALAALVADLEAGRG